MSFDQSSYPDDQWIDPDWELARNYPEDSGPDVESALNSSSDAPINWGRVGFLVALVGCSGAVTLGILWPFGSWVAGGSW